MFTGIEDYLLGQLLQIQVYVLVNIHYKPKLVLKPVPFIPILVKDEANVRYMELSLLTTTAHSSVHNRIIRSLDTPPGVSQIPG